MRRAGFLIIATSAVAALMAVAEPADARLRFGLRAFGAPFGLLSRLAHLRSRHGYRHQGARHAFAHGPRRYGPALGGAAGAAGTAALGAQTASGAQATWTGPVFWPAAYDDMFAAVAPAGGADMRFWSDGFADVLAGILTQPGEERGAARSRPRPIATASAEDKTTGAAPAPETRSCGPLPSIGADDIVSHIEQTVRPKPAQQTAFKDLRTALLKAADDLRRACPDTTPLTPLARLNAMQERLWAMQSAAQQVRTPLAKLYATLDDEQKTRLNGEAPQARPPTSRHRSARRSREAGAPAQVCYMLSRDASAWPVDEIRERVRPNQDQAAGLKSLADTSGGMAKLLVAACPAKPPASAVDRLDAVLGRLESMLYAVSVVSPPLQAFYGSLTDEQKARFNSLGSPSGS